jgi:hypothetical protein
VKLGVEVPSSYSLKLVYIEKVLFSTTMACGIERVELRLLM